MNPSRTGPPARPPRPVHRPPGLHDEPARKGAGRVLRHAAELLHPRLPAFAESALAELRGASSYYGNPLLAPPDLRKSAHTALSLRQLETAGQGAGVEFSGAHAGRGRRSGV